MLYDPASIPHLKPWLVRTLEPICDAEPGALADYILALLKHNVPENEMRQELAVQLEEFLEKECAGFIDTLFTVLRTKSYMPYGANTDSPPLQVTSLDHPVEGIPIPLDGLLTSLSAQEQQRSRKRSGSGLEDDGRLHKGPRLNNIGAFSRYGDGMGGGIITGMEWMARQGYVGGRGMQPFGLPMNGRQQQGYQPPDHKRGICRDYHNNGYCTRGSMCKYSHGDDAIVPGQLYPTAPGIPFMFPGNIPFMPGAAYDPHEARMDMRPRQHQRAPLLPRIQQDDGSVVHPVTASGELPVIQDLTPTIPETPTVPGPLPSDDVEMKNPNIPMVPPAAIPGYNPVVAPGINGSPYQPSNPSMEVDSNIVPGMRPPTRSRGGPRERGRGGRGTFGGEVHSFRPEKRNDRTLVVEKIPEEKLSLDQVNEWFKRFGTVTNVAIDAVGGKALVSFEKHEEAHAAWRSEEAVFGNRFVKLFWHRPLEGHGQVGARMLAASAPLVANMATTARASASTSPSMVADVATTTTISAQSLASANAGRRASALPSSSTASALAVKQKLLEQKIVEQKSLMADLGTASAEQKKEIMARLRNLGVEMTQLTSTPSTLEAPNVPVANGSHDRNNGKALHEQKEKDRLDKELEVHNKTEESSTTDELKAKLDKLKAEAASLGLDSALPSTTTSPSHFRGGFRGRPPRGRGYFRNGPVRGGPPRGSMKLDNRPKKLLVKGVDEGHIQALRDWYETTGQLDNIEPADNNSTACIVSFKSRSAAEQGLAKGLNIPLVGSVQISWYISKEVTSTGGVAGLLTVTPATKRDSVSSMEGVGVGKGAIRSIQPAQDMPEEEIVARGWGVDGDEGDGMGML